MQAITCSIGVLCCALLLRLVAQYGGVGAVILGFVFLVTRSAWTYKCWMKRYAISATVDGESIKIDGPPSSWCTMHVRQHMVRACGDEIFSWRTRNAQKFQGIFVMRPSILQFLEYTWLRWLPSLPGDQVAVSDPLAVKNILGGDVELFSKRHRLEQPGDVPNADLIEESLLRCHEKGTWKRQRQALASTCFGLSTLQFLGPVVKHVAVEYVLQLIDRCQEHGEDIIDITQWTDECALHSILQASVGRAAIQNARGAFSHLGATPRFHELFEDYWHLLRRQYSRSREWNRIPPTELERANCIARISEELRDEVTEQGKHVRRRLECFLSMMKSPLSHSGALVTDKLTPREAMDNMFSFITAGVDASGHTLAMVCWCLGQNPDMQKLVHEEAIRENEKFESSDVKMREYMALRCAEGKEFFIGKVIKEVLRLYPPVTQCLRFTTEDCTVGASGSVSLHIKRDTALFCDVVACNRDPRVWGKDVLEFNPNRWDEGTLTRELQQQCMSFGGGHRKCPAQCFAELDLQLACAELFMCFHVSPVEGSTPNFKQTPSLQLAGGLLMKLEMINKSQTPTLKPLETKLKPDFAKVSPGLSGMQAKGSSATSPGLAGMQAAQSRDKSQQLVPNC